ncbi:MAG: hypothetical protein ACRET5_16430, partial [Steroidobacteraceae bacterium]
MQQKNASSGLLQHAASGLCGILGGISPPGLEYPGLGPLESLKRLVEQHLDSPALSPEFICARSGWSRIPAQPIADP